MNAGKLFFNYYGNIYRTLLLNFNCFKILSINYYSLFLLINYKSYFNVLSIMSILKLMRAGI